MYIDHYSFGSITVNGNSYTKDVIIFPNHVFSPWWRGEGHLLQVGDLKQVIQSECLELIIGTGYYGTMNVPHEIKDYLKSKGIKFCIEKTPEAVEMYNRVISKRAVIAALHLTC